MCKEQSRNELIEDFRKWFDKHKEQMHILHPEDLTEEELQEWEDK